jgi:transcriptional regulator with XRE-family HTH domain
VTEVFIGEKVAEWRKRRGKSQEVLAGLAGVSQPYLSQIERGRRSVERRSTLVALAGALEVSVSELTGQPGDPTHPSKGRATAAVPAIREALVLREAGEVRPAVGASVDAAVSAVNRADYAEAAILLPGLLGSATGVDLVQASYAAMACLGQLGYADLSREAARLGLAAADDLDDPTWTAVADWVHACAVPNEMAGHAVELLRRAAEKVQPHVSDAEARQVYGMLHLLGALRSAVAGHDANAASLLAEAEAEAGTLGDPRGPGFFQLGFGPTNVAIWRTVVLNEIGDAEQAAATAATVQPARLSIPQRQAMYWLDYGRTLVALRRDTAAITAFLRAEAIAPQLVRLLPVVRDTIGVVWRRTRRNAVSAQLRRAAAMVGLRD